MVFKNQEQQQKTIKFTFIYNNKNKYIFNIYVYMQYIQIYTNVDVIYLTILITKSK